MNSPSEGFAEALQLEDIKLSQLLSAAAEKREKDIRASAGNLAARGLSQSGMRFKIEVDLIFTSTEGVVDQMIDYRKELGARVPALLERGNLGTLRTKLDQLADGALNGVRQRATMAPRGAAAASLMQEAERKAYALKARINQKMAALPLEAKLGMHRAEEPNVTTINISHSTIANLNLGTVVGDLNGSIQHLSGTGQGNLAEDLKKLIEAVSASGELADGERKDILEHLAMVSGEAAKPADTRKMAPLKTSIEAIKTGISVATQLVGLWQAVETALKVAGVIHGPT